MKIRPLLLLALAVTAPLHLGVFGHGETNDTRFSVMTYNAWYQWQRVDSGFDKGIESIALSGADIIGFQESSDSHSQEVADALGWFRAASGNGSRQLVSRYPIVDSFSSGNAIGARIRLSESPPREIIVYCCHLDSEFYGPYAARIADATEVSILQEEGKSQRLAQIEEALRGMERQLANADATPVFLVGDFNVPSHLDWTVETAPKHYGVGPVAWPVTQAIEEAGFIDSFRMIRPDPAIEPGETWSPIHKAFEPQDRIDMIHFRGSPIRVLASRTFTTAVQVTVGEWGVPTEPVAGNSWPSDHAAVISTFAIEPIATNTD